MNQQPIQYSANAAQITGSGKRRALIIGINYVKNPRNRLNGCWNDVKNMEPFLRQKGFNDIWILTDETSDPKFIPTRANIIAALRWLVQDVQPGDSLFWHYRYGQEAK
jgi:metacaspase-1